MKHRIKNTETTIKILSWIQIIGGITGLGLIASLLLDTGTINGALFLIFLIGLTLFILSIYSGLQLLKEPNNNKGLFLSAANYFFQIFQFKLLGFGLTYCSAMSLNLGIANWKLSATFSLFLSKFQMSINSENDFHFKINVLAIYFIYVLYTIYLEKNVNEINELENESELPN